MGYTHTHLWVLVYEGKRDENAGPYLYVKFLTSSYRSTGGTTLMEYAMYRMGYNRVVLLDASHRDAKRDTRPHCPVFRTQRPMQLLRKVGVSSIN